MDVLNVLKFFRKKKKGRPLSPIRTVQQPGAIRRERQAREQAEAAALEPTPEERRRQRRERELFDTGSLEVATDSGRSDNPYDTQSWQTNTPQGPRRVDDLKAINKDRKSGQQGNPYDTIVTKKGW
jgi:hypothetical protein